jgi:hypothetical protein
MTILAMLSSVLKATKAQNHSMAVAMYPDAFHSTPLDLGHLTIFGLGMYYIQSAPHVTATAGPPVLSTTE